MTQSFTNALPTTRPRLPGADAILPYLREIDENRWYSNFAPLARKFEARLAAHFHAEPGSVVTISNATAGLTLALQEAAGAVPGCCLLPAWTFVASPVAVVNAGLKPFFVDVDAATWQLTPGIARKALKQAPAAVRAVMVVAPFGAPVDVAAWAAFSEETATPVIIDAAAAFDTAQPHPRIVSVVSLHATKVLGVGEGGFVLAGTVERAEKLRRMSNFGLTAARASIYPGTNAKLSEYSVAVGLASLHEWPGSRRAFIEQAAAYRARIAAAKLNGHIDPRADNHASATFNIILREPGADKLIAWLRSNDIEARKWWAQACHRHPVFTGCDHDDLAVTEDLVRRVVALPFWIDMTEKEMSAVVDRLREYFSR